MIQEIYSTFDGEELPSFLGSGNLKTMHSYIERN